jgi:hypothetical protein
LYTIVAIIEDMNTADRTSLILAAKRYVQLSLGLDAVAMGSLRDTADTAWLTFAAKLVHGQGKAGGGQA